VAAVRRGDGPIAVEIGKFGLLVHSMKWAASSVSGSLR
jgi:hypothetical protein